MRLPELPPHETVRLPLTVSFPGPGVHDLSLELPEDELPGDNRRWVAVPVKDSLLIRLVDGEPSSVPFGSEVDYLAAPLSIGIGAAEAWRVEVVPDQDFLSPRLDPADVLVLANVAALTPEQATRLGPLVKGGMGLMIFTGARLDVGLYNDLLHRDVRLLPYPMKTLIDEPFHGVIVEPVRPSPIEALLELKPTALERVAVKQIMAVDEQGERDRVQVLARWNDPARSPALVERVVGDGRVLLWTTTADRAGNDWPIEPSFVLAVREAVRGTARPTRFDTTLSAGEPMRRIVRSSQQVANARLNPPGGGEPRALPSSPRGPTATTRGRRMRSTSPTRARPASTGSPGTKDRSGRSKTCTPRTPTPVKAHSGGSPRPTSRRSSTRSKSSLPSRGATHPECLPRPAARSGTSWHWGLFSLLVIESLFAAWAGRSR